MYERFVKGAYLKAPFMVELRETKIHAPQAGEVLLKIMACGVCGSDINAAHTAKEFQPFGHELSGIVEEVGEGVTNVKAGDHVAVESSSFCGECANCRNGHVELCTNKLNFTYNGFSEAITVPARMLVPIYDLAFEEGAVIEPFGVAMDLVQVADIELGDHVVVYGAGPIALMAIRLASLKGAGKITVLSHAHSTRRNELAEFYGADRLIFTDQEDPVEALKGEDVQRVLVTTPPATVKDAVEMASFGAIISVIGIARTKEDSQVSLDINQMHFKRLQLRFSHATPALFFPQCIDLIRRGLIDVKPLISHRFALEDVQEAMHVCQVDKQGAVKVMMLRA